MTWPQRGKCEAITCSHSSQKLPVECSGCSRGRSHPLLSGRGPWGQSLPCPGPSSPVRGTAWDGAH